jgi:hypothetical protein
LNAIQRKQCSHSKYLRFKLTCLVVHHAVIVCSTYIVKSLVNQHAIIMGVQHCHVFMNSMMQRVMVSTKMHHQSERLIKGLALVTRIEFHVIAPGEHFWASHFKPLLGFLCQTGAVATLCLLLVTSSGIKTCCESQMQRQLVHKFNNVLLRQLTFSFKCLCDHTII